MTRQSVRVETGWYLLHFGRCQGRPARPIATARPGIVRSFLDRTVTGQGGSDSTIGTCGNGLVFAPFWTLPGTTCKADSHCELGIVGSFLDRTVTRARGRAGFGSEWGDSGSPLLGLGSYCRFSTIRNPGKGSDGIWFGMGRQCLTFKHCKAWDRVVVFRPFGTRARGRTGFGSETGDSGSPLQGLGSCGRFSTIRNPGGQGVGRDLARKRETVAHI